MSSELLAFGICGWSGSGKTTLLVELVRHFTARRLKVAVVKHDVHGLDVDRQGKDSDRLFRAGADVVLLGREEGFCRIRPDESDALGCEVNRLHLTHDLVLVEGNKSAHLARKVWLLKNEGESPPADVLGIARVLGPEEDRFGVVSSMVEEWLQHTTETASIYAGVLFGGHSRRMGKPKHLLRIGPKTWLEHIVATVRPFVSQPVLLGRGEIPSDLQGLPVLPDAPDREGPIAGMLAAMRWRPDACWVFLACDLPRISPEAVQWLLAQRAPGIWAVLPRRPGSQPVEPLFACYEPRARRLLENSRSPCDLARQSNVSSPVPPAEFADAWISFNTPAEAAHL